MQGPHYCFAGPGDLLPGTHRYRTDGGQPADEACLSTHTHVRRIWTVELRPQTGGPSLRCPHCTSQTLKLCRHPPHVRLPWPIWPTTPVPTHCCRTCAPASAGNAAAAGTHATAAAPGRYVSPSPATAQAAPGGWPTPARPARGRPVIPPWCRTPSSAPSGRTPPRTSEACPRRTPPGTRRAGTRTGDAHLPRRALPASPAARLLGLQCALRADTRGHVRLLSGAVARHAPARAPGPVAGTGPRQLVGAAECPVGPRTAAAARCHGPGPGARPPRPPARRPLGAASRPTGPADGTARPATDRPGPGRTYRPSAPNTVPKWKPSPACAGTPHSRPESSSTGW